jgi:epsilon-lactone hydrolase
LISPLGGTHAGLPPLLIQAGTEELLAPDAGLLAASASAAGVDVTYTRWPRMWHDFTLQAGVARRGRQRGGPGGLVRQQGNRWAHDMT